MAAFGAVVLQIASFVIQLPAIADAPGADDPLRYRETLINFHEHSAALLGSGIANALGVLLCLRRPVLPLPGHPPPARRAAGSSCNGWS